MSYDLRDVTDGTSNTIAFGEWCSNDYSMSGRRKGVGVENVPDSSPSALVGRRPAEPGGGLAGLQNCTTA